MTAKAWVWLSKHYTSAVKFQCHIIASIIYQHKCLCDIKVSQPDMSGTTVSCVYIPQQAQQWHNPRLRKQQPRNSNTTKYSPPVKGRNNKLVLPFETKVQSWVYPGYDSKRHNLASLKHLLFALHETEGANGGREKELRERKVFRKRQRVLWLLAANLEPLILLLRTGRRPRALVPRKFLCY